MNTYNVYVIASYEEGIYSVSCPELFDEILVIDIEQQDIFEAVELILSANLPEKEEFNTQYFGHLAETTTELEFDLVEFL
jgi:hypothetical protein